MYGLIARARIVEVIDESTRERIVKRNVSRAFFLTEETPQSLSLLTMLLRADVNDAVLMPVHRGVMPHTMGVVLKLDGPNLQKIRQDLVHHGGVVAEARVHIYQEHSFSWQCSQHILLDDVAYLRAGMAAHSDPTAARSNVSEGRRVLS